MKAVFIFLFAILSYSLHAQANYRFNNFTISNGLSQSVVTTIVQDETSKLWVGTQDGLNRFDGKEFEVFYAGETIGLDGNRINCSEKTTDGRIWFGTSTGLVAFNPLNEKFRTFKNNTKLLLQIRSLQKDEYQNLYVFTSNQGLLYFNTQTEQFQPIYLGVPNNKIANSFFLIRNKILFNSPEKGLYIHDLKSKKNSLLSSDKLSFETLNINCLHSLDSVKYLLGTNQGVYELNLLNLSITPKFTELETFGKLNINHIVYFEKSYYLASEENGLFTVDSIGRIFNSTEDSYQKSALLYNTIHHLYIDNNKKIWVGSDRGLSSFDPSNSGFLSIGPSGNTKRGLPSPNVWSFHEDENNATIFVGTDVGISKFDRNNGDFEQYYFNNFTKESKYKNVVLCTQNITPSRLLVGCAKGLYELNIQTGAYTFREIKFLPSEKYQSHNRVYSIVKKDANEYLLATKGGVVLYNILSKKSTFFEYDKNNPNFSIGQGICRIAKKGPDGRIWFATEAGGLYLGESTSTGFQITPHPLNNQLFDAINDYFTCLAFLSEDELWLGTSESGIVNIDLKNNTFRHINNKNGLPNNVIYGVLTNGSNELWLSTNRGLVQYKIDQDKIKVYKEINGLVSNEFNSNAYFKAKNGEFFFGGINGFNHFFPNKLTTPNNDLKVIFNKFKLAGEWLSPNEKNSPLKTVISNTKILELDYSQRSFTLKFHTNDLHNPLLVQYKYVLEGGDEVEQFLGNINEINFNALSAGDYTLNVYARIGDSPWSEPTSMDITIKPPYWSTWWFWTLVGLFFSIITFILFKRRIEMARREQVKLEVKIAERTKEIRVQKSQIEEQNRLIELEKNKVVEQQRLLQIEKDNTEKWLNNTLPTEAVIALKNKGKVTAKAFDTVSVLFTDVVGFSKISESIPPSLLVNKLDVLFRKFDEIVEKNNLEKIKTIGDAYMCAGGVPTENSTNPIDACCAALQIQDYMSKLKYDAIANEDEFWEIRLGINTGPLTAGIIGNLRLAYDVWGPTVNLAQRMEMLGEPGKVTITGETFDFIEPYFECEFKGKVQSKARKWVNTYIVKQIKPELSVKNEGLVPNTKFTEIVQLHHFSSIKYYQTQHHVLDILERNLNPKYYYHSIHHTRDVVNAVERIALLEGVTDESLFLLKTAAILHDAGFIEKYDNNETIGARLAGEILPKYGYTEQHIQTIVELIHVTEIPHKPTNKIQEIICDADLDYLGRDDFDEISDSLRRELKEMGKIKSDKEWDEIQVKFLNNHRYFTKTSISMRRKKKLQNLKKVEERLKRNNYKD